MRVQIDGLLPLITKSTVEYPNGDEVVTTLVYERLDKHCTKCLRLDHELKECLVARAEAKAEKTSQRVWMEGTGLHSAHAGDHTRGVSDAPARRMQNPKDTEQRTEAFQFSASNNGNKHERRPSRDYRGSSHHRPYKSQPKIWQEKSSLRRSSQARERSHYEYENSSRPDRDHSTYRRPPGLPSRNFYREIQQKFPENRETGSSASKTYRETLERGIPQQNNHSPIPQEVLEEARGELRDVMLQYTKSADPTEREARKERVRQAEEQGEMEETAIQMAIASLNENAERNKRAQLDPTPERIPATQRLGTTHHQQSTSAGRDPAEPNQNSQERVPASLRLGPAEPQSAPHKKLDISTKLTDTERLPATLRLGPILSPPPKKIEKLGLRSRVQREVQDAPLEKDPQRKKFCHRNKRERREELPRKRTPQGGGK
ncbi:unnamed protein product [Brassica rapa]|uniref:Zinc knuckle CX2CX4HX4C domain-containing protein n=1 Tax=Brassica campestris TaxID=3711 RepID=A0A8D9D4Q3_BRACM|nr:unnamed protein product [Brassica rapa]